MLREAIGLYRGFGFQPFPLPRVTGRCDQAFGLDLGVTAGGPEP